MTTALPTVFIPALLCDAALYAGTIDALGDRVDAQVLMSPQPDLAASVVDILARAPARFALVGTSYGSNLALEVALAAPERVAALWLMGCNPGAQPAGGPDVVAGLTDTPDAMIDLFSGLVVAKEDVASAAAFKAMAHRVGGTVGADQAHALGTRADRTARLGELTMPILLLWGSEDPLVPVAVGREMAAAMQSAVYREIAGCGHLPTLERPAESAGYFAELLATLDR